MVCKIILLLSCVICYIYLETGVDKLLKTTELQDKLKTLCPHSSFCDELIHINETSLQTTHTDRRLMPCCTSCSCSKDCGRKRNCCTHEHDIYKLDETLDTICKQLQPYPDSDYYHIVDKCPNRLQNCRLVGINRLDHFLPVYSSGNGMIYFNKACAKCNGQTNITTFKKIVTCEHVFVSFFSAIKGIDADQLNDGCALNYIPPDGIDLYTELCYPFQIKTCDIRSNSSDEIRTLCKSFNATFHATHNTYSNVFCFLCNSKGYHPTEVVGKFEFCPVADFQKLNINMHLTVILDKAFEAESVSKQLNRANYKFPKWCTWARNTTWCRPLFCPEGQDYKNGKCRQMAKRWYFNRLRMVVKLTNTEKQSDNLQYQNINGTFLELDRPGFEDWDYTLLYNLDRDEKTINYFVAFLTYKYKTVQPKHFISTVKKSFLLDWRLHCKNTTVVLQPTFNKFIVYKRTNISDETTILPVIYGIDQSLTKSFESNSSSYLIEFLFGIENIFEQEGNKNTIFLSKLFFCNLIELREDEYMTGVFNIYLIGSGRFMGDGEYIWTSSKEGDDRIRICAEDIGEGVISGVGKPLLFKIGTMPFVWMYVFICIFGYCCKRKK